MRKATEVQLPSPDGRTVGARYEAGTVTWVDGGMLRNFPIDAFERDDGHPPRWPTIGIKLSSLQTSYGATQAVTTAFAVARHCLKTMMNEWDAYSIDAATAGRTIFVDHGSVGTTDFNITTRSARPVVPERRGCGDVLRDRDGDSGPGSEDCRRVLGLTPRPPGVRAVPQSRTTRRQGRPAANQLFTRSSLIRRAVGMSAQALSRAFSSDGSCE